jgi:hypothetical protein
MAARGIAISGTFVGSRFIAATMPDPLNHEMRRFATLCKSGDESAEP